jgi:methionyl-tRNA formyltransferase
MRLLLTAGYDRAPHVSLLAMALVKDGHEIAGLLVVTPYSAKRALALLRQRGRSGLLKAASKLKRPAKRDADALDRLAEEWALTPGSLRAFAREAALPYKVAASLNAPAALEFVRGARADGVIYGGGGIVGAGFLEAAGGRVLNAHSGPLPEIRGMNALEWSLLLGLKPAVTIHHIDRGIDTGPTVAVRPVKVEPGDDVETLRAKCVAEGVRGLRENIGAFERPTPERAPDAAAHRQCFVMAPALRALLDAQLGSGK